MVDGKKKEAAATGAGAATTVKWDDSAMSTTYANVCNVSSTREEVTLLFGTNQTLLTGQNELSIKLSDRIIISPYTARRMLNLLGNVMEQYENKFGKLDVVAAPPAPTTGEKKP
jgi:hypothetical protein